jgi:asparagine synthase (glutamine-hydrolysing)
VLRRILDRHVPPALTDRPKRGFAAPIALWLHGPLRDWADDLLREDRLRADGLLKPEPIRLLWREHLSGARNHDKRLWNVLMFQAWLDARRGMDA